MYEEVMGRPIKRLLATGSLNLKDHTGKFDSNLRERRLKIDLYSIKENIQRGEIQLLWVDGEENPADGLTKSTKLALAPLIYLMNTGTLPVTNMLAYNEIIGANAI